MEKEEGAQVTTRLVERDTEEWEENGVSKRRKEQEGRRDR